MAQYNSKILKILKDQTPMSQASTNEIKPGMKVEVDKDPYTCHCQRVRKTREGSSV